jgi:hypothetical protein
MGPRKMKAAIEATSRKEMGSYKESRVFIICLPPHSSHKMHPLDKGFMGPRKYSNAKKLKNCSVRRSLPNWQTVRKLLASCNRRDSD